MKPVTVFHVILGSKRVFSSILESLVNGVCQDIYETTGVFPQIENETRIPRDHSKGV